MAERQRLSLQRLATDLPILHLAIGLATLAYVVRRRPAEGDPEVFFRMAETIASGRIPYRDVPFEYPPLALAHIYLPRLISGSNLNHYEWAFTFLGLGVALATAAVVYWLARAGWSLNSVVNTMLIFVSLVLAILPLVVWRFDILPTLLTALALAAFASRRDAWTGIALGLGTVAKLYPAFVGPVFFGVRLVERRFRSAGAMVVAATATVGVVFVGLYLLAGRDGLSFLLYQDERGIEVEAVAGGLALLADALGVAAARIFFGFGSWQVESPVLDQVALPVTLFNWALVVALVGSAVWQFRADVRASGSVQPRTVVAYVVGTLLVVILTNKVLSPQYLVWLLPFAALLSKRQSLFVVLIVALTTLIYPMGFKSLLDIRTSSVLALNARNLMLVALFVWVIWPPRWRLSLPAWAEPARVRASEGGDV